MRTKTTTKQITKNNLTINTYPLTRDSVPTQMQRLQTAHVEQTARDASLDAVGQAVGTREEGEGGESVLTRGRSAWDKIIALILYIGCK